MKIKRLVASGRYEFNFEGVPVYSKGVIREVGERESEFYILISGKRSVASD